MKEEWEKVELLDRVDDYTTEWLISTDTHTAIGTYVHGQLVYFREMEVINED